MSVELYVMHSTYVLRITCNSTLIGGHNSYLVYICLSAYTARSIADLHREHAHLVRTMTNQMECFSIRPIKCSVVILDQSTRVFFY